MILNLSLVLFWDESVLYLFHAITNFVFFFLITVTCIRAPHLSLARPLLLPFPQPHPFTVLRTWALHKMWKMLNL